MISNDIKLLITLVLTFIVSIALLAFCFIAFKMGNTGIGFLFAFLTLVAFVGCLVEGFILYGYYVNALVDKGKGIITLLWAIFSIVVTIVVMWGHRLNLWTTLLAIAILLVLFFVPYLLSRKYSDRIEYFLYNRLHATFLRKVISDDKGKVEATNDPITLSKPHIKTEDEIKLIEEEIAHLSKELIESLPKKLRDKHALLLLVLLRDEGYLGDDLRPSQKDNKGKINNSLYAYIAQGISIALIMGKGKWPLFEEFWNITNGSQSASSFISYSQDTSQDQQDRIKKIFRRATRLDPLLETTASFKKFIDE